MFGLSLPSTRLESISLILWQFIRLLLHHIWIGRILSRRAGGLFCNAGQRKDALITARELALIFNRLNQLHLTSNSPNNVYGLIFAICSMNMAEVADGLLTSNELSSIYTMMALRIKNNYSNYLKFVVRYFLNRAKYENAKVPRPSKYYQWAYTAYGYQYILSNDFTYNTNEKGMENEISLFTQLKNPADPISHIIKVSLKPFFTVPLKYFVSSVL